MTMTNYDHITEAYLQAAKHPVKEFAEAPSFMDCLDDIYHQDILDLACGDGYYTRLIKKIGAARVVGVDISQNMLAQAQVIEDQAPLGITYHLGDVAHLKHLGIFDQVSAIYLLCYANSRAKLKAMLQKAYDHLKPGGQFNGITLNPGLGIKDLTRYTPYGIHLATRGPLTNGQVLSFRIQSPGQKESFELSPNFWEKAIYEDYLAMIGFQDITWRKIEVTAKGLGAYGSSYWQAFSEKPYSIILSASRPKS